MSGFGRIAMQSQAFAADQRWRGIQAEGEGWDRAIAGLDYFARHQKWRYEQERANEQFEREMDFRERQLGLTQQQVASAIRLNESAAMRDDERLELQRAESEAQIQSIEANTAFTRQKAADAKLLDELGMSREAVRQAKLANDALEFEIQTNRRRQERMESMVSGLPAGRRKQLLALGAEALDPTYLLSNGIVTDPATGNLRVGTKEEVEREIERMQRISGAFSGRQQDPFEDIARDAGNMLELAMRAQDPDMARDAREVLALRADVVAGKLTKKEAGERAAAILRKGAGAGGALRPDDPAEQMRSQIQPEKIMPPGYPQSGKHRNIPGLGALQEESKYRPIQFIAEMAEDPKKWGAPPNWKEFASLFGEWDNLYNPVYQQVVDALDAPAPQAAAMREMFASGDEEQQRQAARQLMGFFLDPQSEGVGYGPLMDMLAGLPDYRVTAKATPFEKEEKAAALAQRAQSLAAGYIDNALLEAKIAIDTVQKAGVVTKADLEREKGDAAKRPRRTSLSVAAPYKDSMLRFFETYQKAGAAGSVMADKMWDPMVVGFSRDLPSNDAEASRILMELESFYADDATKRAFVISVRRHLRETYGRGL